MHFGLQSLHRCKRIYVLALLLAAGVVFISFTLVSEVPEFVYIVGSLSYDKFHGNRIGEGGCVSPQIFHILSNWYGLKHSSAMPSPEYFNAPLMSNISSNPHHD